MTGNNRLHAIAARYGITHAELHAWAIRNFEVEHITEVPDSTLHGLADMLDNPQKALEFRIKYQVPPPVNEPLFTPDQWRDLHAEADAIAERFRQ